MIRTRHIAFASDRDFQIPLALALYSLERTLECPEHYEVHILHQGIDEELFAPIGLKLHFYHVGHALRDLPTQKRLPTPTYYRFLLPDLLPDTVEHALYLDCDIMVLRDLSELWDLAWGDQIIAACPWVIYGGYCEEYEQDVTHFSERIGYGELGEPEHYFYASILLMNLVRMRAESITQQLIDTSRTIPAERLAWQDQDVLNHVLRGRITPLPLSYNVIPLFAQDLSRESEEARIAYTNPHILHFAAMKPNILTGAKLPFEKEFFELWRQSPWARHIPYPLVSLRELPRLLRALIELPIRWGIRHEPFLLAYGRALQWLRARLKGV